MDLLSSAPTPVNIGTQETGQDIEEASRLQRSWPPRLDEMVSSPEIMLDILRALWAEDVPLTSRRLQIKTGRSRDDMMEALSALSSSGWIRRLNTVVASYRPAEAAPSAQAFTTSLRAADGASTVPGHPF